MYYFAYINASNICTSVYAMPSDLSTVPGYVAISEAEYTSQSVIGKRWNASTSTWEEVVEYFYAVLDEKDICINVVEMETELPSDPCYIRIDSLNQSLIGQWYNRETQTFQVEIPFRVVAAHSTNEINVGTSDVSLTTKLTQLESAIGNAGSGSGEAGADGADGEDGGYYTPAVSADGTLSWTASKEGMPAVGSVNIKGADGAPGAAGQDGAPGADGAAGANGVTFTPVMTGTTLSWTNDGGLQNPPSVDLKGEKGDAGDAATIDAYTKTQVDNKLAGKADTDHTHDYAPSTHTHSTGDISGLTSLLAGKANSDHTHNTYALSYHTHSQYFPSTGGTITGETNFSGGLVRLKGVQTLFHSGSQLVFGSNNLPTRIGGSAISATKTITVDSDRTLKENIADVNDDNPDITAADCLNFIDALEVKTYNYKGDSEECIGVIAQDIEGSPLAKYLVRTTAEGKKAVKVADLVFPLIVAVQALSDHVKRLEK